MTPYSSSRRLALMVTFLAFRLSSSASLGATNDGAGESLVRNLVRLMPLYVGIYASRRELGQHIYIGRSQILGVV